MLASRVGCVCVIALGLIAPLGGCGVNYATPGGPADLMSMGLRPSNITPEQQAERTDSSIQARLNRRPAASFPATIAVVRVQAAGYRSYSYQGRPRREGDAFSVITARDIELDTDTARLAALPYVRGVAAVNRLLLPDRLGDLQDLRGMAADLQADMLVLYTLDTTFEVDKKVPALGTLSLGLFPDRRAQISSTCSAAIVDTRSGYIYGLAEATQLDDQLANFWTSEDAVDQTRRRAERKAFERMLGELETTWKGVVAAHVGPGAPAVVPTSAPAAPKP